MVESIMRAVVEHVVREGTRNDAISPRSREEEMGQSREWIRQRRKKDRWHHQPQWVHWKVMMNAVHQEMQHEEHRLIREVVVDVEEKPVHCVLEESEEKVSKDVQWNRFRNGDG